MSYKLESGLLREIPRTSYADDTNLMTENDEELKRVKEESEKASLKLNIQKTNIMASSPISSWQIDGEKIIFLGSKITEDGDYSPEIKRCLFLGRKAMRNIDST